MNFTYMEKFRFIKLFNVKSVPINIHWSLSLFFICLMLAGFINLDLLFLVLIYCFIILIMLLHELGHMWFAYRLGLKTVQIELY